MIQVKMRHYNPEVKALSSLYDLLSAVADGFPDKGFESYSKKQRQDIISNLISFSDEHVAVLSPEMNEIIYPYPELSFDKLRGILKSTNKRHMESMTARYDEWSAFAERFDKLTKDALVRFIDECVFSFDLLFLPNSQTGNASFSSRYTNAYRQILHLENAVFPNNFNTESHETDDAEIDVLDDGYRVSFVQTEKVMSVYFSDIRLETQLLNYSNTNRCDGSPWTQISESLTALGHKKDVLGMDFLNEKEKNLWRLDEFSPIHSMESSYQSISGDIKTNELFCDFARRTGNDRIIELTEQYANAKLNAEHPHTGIHKKNKACKVLQKELKKPESEVLARLILAELKEATAEYPTDVELDIAPEVLADSRNIVTEILKQRGYESEYPHFKKMSSLKGIRLLEIQGQPVFVGNEKHMACMIDCSESSMNFKKLGIECTVSTVFLKKDELHLFDSLDGRSGFFPFKHRRRARTLAPNFDFWDDDILSYDLESSIITAAKVAECGKLTKEERKNMAISSEKIESLFFCVFFLLLGLAFALLFCPAMFLLALIIGAPITVVSSEVPSFSEYFSTLLFEFPWWQMFLFCFVGFGLLSGLTMTIFTAFSRKQR